MKKSILFCCHSFEMGGIQKCMINLLNAMDTTKYEIDVLALHPSFELLDLLQADVNLLDTYKYIMTKYGTFEYLKRNKASLTKYLKYYVFRLVNKLGKQSWKLYTAPEKEYDIAIAYAHNGQVPYYVIDCVKAKKKYMWHHEGRCPRDEYYPLMKKYYPVYDGIIAVSNSDREILVNEFPEIRENVKVLYNVIPKEEIRQKAKETIKISKKNKIKLVTVGRMSQQKGPDLLIETARKLVRDGYEFIWYWDGDGVMMEDMKAMIEKNHLSEQVSLLGNRKNPYPYIQMCDIYVQPSYYEAYCTTTLEAQVLEKPIVVTDVPGMREQFGEEEGKIVPVDSEKICAAIEELIDHPITCKQMSEKLHEKMYTEDHTLDGYYRLFDQE